MIYAVALALLVLAIICRSIGHSWFFPPATYSLYWAAILIASTIITIGNYSLTLDSLEVFLLGCVCVGVGGIVALALFARRRPSGMQMTESRTKIVQIGILVYGIGLLALVPAYIDAVVQAGRTLGVDSFSIAARLALSQPDRMGISRFFQTFTSVAGMLAYYAAWLYNGSRRDKIVLAIAVLAPLVMSGLTFARSPVYALIIGVLAILAFRQKISKPTLVIAVLLTLMLALGLGALLEKGPNFQSGDSPIEAVVDNLGVYYVGGPLGFAQVMDRPTLVGESGLSLRFITQAEQSLGADIQLPNNVLGYVSPDLGNVYTAYFAYWLDWKWLGIVVFSLLLGFVSSMVYVLARRGNGIAGAAIALVVSSLLNSAVGDGLFGSAIPWLLIIGIGLALYYMPLPVTLLSKKAGRETSLAVRQVKGRW